MVLWPPYGSASFFRVRIHPETFSVSSKLCQLKWGLIKYCKFSNRYILLYENLGLGGNRQCILHLIMHQIMKLMSDWSSYYVPNHCTSYILHVYLAFKGKVNLNRPSPSMKQ